MKPRWPASNIWPVMRRQISSGSSSRISRLSRLNIDHNWQRLAGWPCPSLNHSSRPMDQTIKTDVVIIGAGPTGLSLATQSIRYGIDFVIVEKNEGVTPFSKAIGVQARTLEIYEQLGLAQKAVEQGAIAGKVRLLAGGEMRAELDLSNIGQGLSA